MSRRVLVVALNPALDITHQLATVDWAGVNRPVAVMARAGGKGLNVARTLLALGTRVLVTGLAGGRIGEAVQAGLAAAGVPAAFTAIAGETRRTFAVVDAGRGQTAMFNEPGPDVTPAEYARFRAAYAREVASSSAVVMCGSLPPDLPADSYAELVAVAAAAGVPTILDADGKALSLGVAARPTIVKPNLAELASALDYLPLKDTVPGRGTGDTGAQVSRADLRDASEQAMIAAVGQLRSAGAREVVLSMGEAGLLAVTGEGTWRATPPHAVAGNATGAGDAVLAALAHGLVHGQGWPERLRQAAALGSAAAAAPVAGEFRPEDYERALAGASVTVRRET